MKRIRFFSRDMDPAKAQREPKAFTLKPKTRKRIILRKRNVIKMPTTQTQSAN
jgi:hypothetical protein